MRFAHFVRTLGLLLSLGLAGLAGGCSSRSSGPLSKEQSEQIRESKKKAHQQIQQQTGAKRGGANRPGPARRGG